jgi:hypothetical protein
MISRYIASQRKKLEPQYAVRIYPAFPTTSGANDLAGSDQTLTAFAA